MSKQPLVEGNPQWDYPEQNPEYQGEQLDDRLKQGPLEERGCTDCFWCILFLGQLAMLIAISVFAFTEGYPDAVFVSYNSTGYQCGNGTQSGCPFSYVVNFVPLQSICVSSCPVAQDTLKSCDGVPKNYADYSSDNFLHVCSPNKDAGQQFLDAFSIILGYTANIARLDDVDKVWPVSLTVAAIAFILSIFIMYMIKWCGRILVWTVISLYVISLIAFGTLFFFAAKGDLSSFHFAGQDWLYALAYTLWAFGALSLVLVICFRNKIELAVSVLKAAADFTKDVWEAIFVPLAVFGIVIVFLVYWLFSSTYILATGTAYYSTSAQPFPGISVEAGTGWMMAGNFFSFYWNSQFAMAFCQYVIASCCSMWYFHHMGVALHHPVSKSVIRGMVHHSGSIALGSFILMLVNLVKWIFKIIHQAMKNSVQNNKAAEGCLKCWFGYCGCILHCFERFLRFLTQNAYIMMAIQGQSFCQSAHHAFYLVMRNKASIAVTDGIGEIFTTISNLFIGAASALIGFVMITQIPAYSETITSPLFPTLFFLFIALIIGSLFMNIYGMATDTILLCYLADVELFHNQGGAQSVPPALKEFLDTYYKQ
ncbi:hypothetical protein pb186bvf_003227 [Paramecium bursaria]